MMETILRILVDPLVLWTIALNILVFLILKYLPKNLKIVLIGFIVLTIAFTNPWLAERAIRELEIYGIENSELGTTSKRAKIDCSKYAGVIALGGVIPNKTLDRERGIQILSGAERLTEPVALKRMCPEFKIIFSSFGPELDRDVGESELARDLWISLGIPESDIYIENSSTNTRENALFVRNLLVKKELSKETWLLVTSAIHMKRAHLTFEKLNLQTIPISVDFFWSSPPSLFDFNPLQSIESWQKCIHEKIGFIYYELLYN